jgi:hypothetical protein
VPVTGGGLHAPPLGGDHEPGAGGAHPDDEEGAGGVGNGDIGDDGGAGGVDIGDDGGAGGGETDDGETGEGDGTVAPTGDSADVAVTALDAEAAGVAAPSIVAPQRRHVDHAAGTRKPQPGQVLTKSPRGGSPGAEILSRRDAAAA